MNPKRVIYRKSICQKVKDIVSKDFSNATLITLHCAAAVAVPPELAKKIFRGWVYQARRIAGGTFSFIKIIDYGPHPIPEIVFHVIVDLPESCCIEICNAWFMGEATAKPLNIQSFIEVADSIMRQNTETINSKCRIWSYCHKDHRPLYSPACAVEHAPMLGAVIT